MRGKYITYTGKKPKVETFDPDTHHAEVIRRTSMERLTPRSGGKFTYKDGNFKITGKSGTTALKPMKGDKAMVMDHLGLHRTSEKTPRYTV